ncbi:glycosyltransferase family 2 protein [Pontibacter sp. MBLB2868]|uniref:glycosyltransferase family 2 protein n=1 Tax=Pontibacter sp. MBLB2868 TaxID=3451555 RepID=UPI003F755DDD
MIQLPLVTVICLCYNHERFLIEALDSVLHQTYPHLEIIVVDDMSIDGSAAIISEYVQQHPEIKYIRTGRNMGNCAAFNMGWRTSKGAFVLDFATDDVLLPDRVAQQVKAFSQLGNSYGVIYTDAEYITDNGTYLYTHSQKYKPAKDGYIFAELLERYFICPPTMLIRREVLEELNGYDATLAYEDFDFWIRSSRTFKYSYLNKVTTKRRIHDKALSAGLYKKGNRLLASTVQVCMKAADLVRTPRERAALCRRLRYEARQAYLTGNFTEAGQLLDLLKAKCGLSFLYRILQLLNEQKIDMGFLRDVYLKLR